MAELSWEIALNLAGSLLTIGHPRQPAAIQATALDLQAWCKGAILNGRAITPEDQALRLVMEVRTTWEGWPEKGGTKELLALFRRMFEPGNAEFRPFEPPPPPSCDVCGDSGWEIRERNGLSGARKCIECSAKPKAAVVCPDCGGKETRLIDGRREPCTTCLSPLRRQSIRDWLNQRKETI